MKESPTPKPIVVLNGWHYLTVEGLQQRVMLTKKGRFELWRRGLAGPGR